MKNKLDNLDVKENIHFKRTIFTGLGLCQPAIPTFTWHESETSPTGVPLLSINFNDGGASDVAILKQINPIRRQPGEREEDIDSCIFDGFLQDESKVYITLTGGCTFEDTFDVSEESCWSGWLII